ncbi:hypothetical protein DFP72DRAFT_1153415 [Ephemerocybe angulata]|uniref:Uncharacterized protein n=1 Tax=Ephemerocybe angulata TaxID=980116 RepID=A0A8H6LVS8_9AGAR|nr:hypothetical protein DFP72DRAFT_1153415 [Tulosesus angulatus]
MTTKRVMNLRVCHTTHREKTLASPRYSQVLHPSQTLASAGRGVTSRTCPSPSSRPVNNHPTPFDLTENLQIALIRSVAGVGLRRRESGRGCRSNPRRTSSRRSWWDTGYLRVRDRDCWKESGLGQRRRDDVFGFDANLGSESTWPMGSVDVDSQPRRIKRALRQTSRRSSQSRRPLRALRREMPRNLSIETLVVERATSSTSRRRLLELREPLSTNAQFNLALASTWGRPSSPTPRNPRRYLGLEHSLSTPYPPQTALPPYHEREGTGHDTAHLSFLRVRSHFQCIPRHPPDPDLPSQPAPCARRPLPPHPRKSTWSFDLVPLERNGLQLRSAMLRYQVDIALERHSRESRRRPVSKEISDAWWGSRGGCSWSTERPSGNGGGDDPVWE